MDGLVLDGSGFEVVAADVRVGPRRLIGDADRLLLEGLAVRYVRAVQSGADHDVFVGLGRELFAWLDGDHSQVRGLLERVVSPLVFEVRGPKTPSAGAWSVLRAPWELLASPEVGLLAEDGLLRFAVVRRLGAVVRPERLDGLRLGLAFMASSPSGQRELDFEAEEAAILAAVGDVKVDLVVDDSGDPQQLGGRLAALGGMPVVHLSCHGVNNWRFQPGGPGVPVLMMEDGLGRERPTTAADLARMLTVKPRLLFVSACLTATGADAAGHLPPGEVHKGASAQSDGGALVAHSLATGLVSAGVPAVIGWDGSVEDRAATVFAQHLYQAVADRADLAVAVGDARRMLLRSDDAVVREYWHLARLWLGPAGGGPVVGGAARRSLVSAVHGTKAFLGRGHQVPVAAAEMFVGRRVEMQQTLRALASGEYAGVLLHGQGRLGKSSLAARVADRLPDRAVAVVFGDYTALAIVDAVANAVRTNVAARGLIADRLPEVRRDPEALESLLVDLLSGPLAQVGADGKPLLLVIDDLEQILRPDPDGPHRVVAEYAPVLVAMLRAFDPAYTTSRLLMTSRFTFQLGGLETCLERVQLPPLSGVGRRKLQRRQQGLASAQQLTERAGLIDRAVAVCGGNPGLQDLVVHRLLYGAQVPLARAEAVVAGMQQYLEHGGLPSDAEVRMFLENLALDALLEEAGPSHRELLRACTVFELPVPESVVEVLAGQVGGSTARLRGFGLLDSYGDVHDPTALAVAVNPLAAGRLEPVTQAEGAVLARVSVRPLLDAWGGPGSGRAPEADLQLARLGLSGGDPAVVAECAEGAVHQLRVGRAVEAFEWGREAVGMLDRHSVPVPVGVLRAVADAALTSGDGVSGGQLLERAVNEVQFGGRTDAVNALDRARVLVQHGRHLVTLGQLGQAERLFQQSEQLFTAAGSDIEAAVAAGHIADIAFQRGEYEEALRIRREVQLPVYERLGDARETAVVWSSVADIAFRRGEYEEALRIRRELVLPVFERLGEARAGAVTWSGIADIAYRRGEYEEALRIRREVTLPVYERLGDAREVAVAWGKIADIVFQRGEYGEALRIRREVTLPVYERLGDAREVAVTWGKIADIAYQRGDYDEALRIRREVALPVFERLGEAREVAVAWGRIADIAFQRGDYDEALRIRREVALPVYERLGDVREVALTWGKIANIAFERGAYEEAAELQRKRLAVNEQLGDLDGIAGANWDLARIALLQHDYDEAVLPMVTAYRILGQLGRPDGIAVVGLTLGRLLQAAGLLEEAREVWEQSLAAATVIDSDDLINKINGLLDPPAVDPGLPDRPL